MKKQLTDETKDAVFTEIERNHKCIIKKCIPSGEAEKSESVPVFADGGITSNSSRKTSTVSPPTLRFSVFRSRKGSTKADVDSGGLSVKIYSDDRRKLDKVWGEVKRRITQYIKEKEISDDVIKKFTDGHTKTLRKLERDFDVTIKVNQIIGNIKIKGHIDDVAVVQEEIHKILKEIIENEPKGKNFRHSNHQHSPKE